MIHIILDKETHKLLSIYKIEHNLKSLNYAVKKLLQKEKGE